MHRLPLAFGLALLYASAYFLPFLNPYSLYFIPSFFGYIVIPSLVSVCLLTPLFVLCGSRIIAPAHRRAFAFVGTILLTFIAAKSMLDAAGYPWVNLLTYFSIPVHVGATQTFRLERMVLVGFVAVVALLLVYLNRHRIAKLLKFQSALGYSFLFLAIYRCVAADMVREPAKVDPPAIAAAPADAARRVVWVIFDEMDYGLAFGTNREAASRLPNFSRLAAKAVSATDAYAPGRDTLYSIPALLTGTTLSGVAIDHREHLNLRDRQGKTLPFSAENSVFARLPGGAGSASVLGFYHPYCKVMPALQRCHSSYLGNAGRWFDSLTFFSEALFSALRHWDGAVQNLPEWLWVSFDPMYRASSDALSRLDGAMRNQASALDFIHVNVPHLPNVYMQRQMHQPVHNEADAYRKNLAGADQLLGRIVQHLEASANQQKILLIVSSDHWLRTHSSAPANVPFFAWIVGSRSGLTLSQPLSTVHSAQLALDFIGGKINSQAEIANSLGQANFSPPWIAPDGYKY